MTMTLSGDGAITGLVAGGLPDATIQTADIVDGAVTAAKIAGGTGSGNLTQYTATTNTLPAATAATTISHSLGIVPVEAVLEIICITAEHGYSIGDVIQNPSVSTGAFAQPVLLWKSATQVGFGWAAATTGWAISNKTTAANVAPTLANWAYRFRLRTA